MMGSLGANPPPSILVRGPLFVGCRMFKNDLSRPKITVDLQLSVSRVAKKRHGLAVPQFTLPILRFSLSMA